MVGSSGIPDHHTYRKEGLENVKRENVETRKNKARFFFRVSTFSAGLHFRHSSGFDIFSFDKIDSPYRNHTTRKRGGLVPSAQIGTRMCADNKMFQNNTNTNLGILWYMKTTSYYEVAQAKH